MVTEVAGLLRPHRQDRWPVLLRFPFPIRALARRWRGMLGMIAGVGVALGMVLTLMGILGTAMGVLIGDFPQSGANMFVYANGGAIIPLGRGSNEGRIDHAGGILSKMRSLRGVSGALGVLSWSLQNEHEGREARNLPADFVPALAVDGDPADITASLVLEDGRWLRRGNEMVLGKGLAASKSWRIGDTLKLTGQEYEVVGIGKMRGFGAVGDLTAYVDARNLRQRGVIGDVLSYIAIQTREPDIVRSVAADFPTLRAVGSRQLLDETFSSRDYMAGAVTYWVMDCFILFVAGMFVSNMLGRSVAERRLEFGTLRAIGLPSRSILLSVIAEALFIVLASYAAGFVFSLALGEVTNRLLAAPLGVSDLFGVDPTAYSIIFVLTLALGAAAGYFPARRATRVDPLEVLRQA